MLAAASACRSRACALDLLQAAQAAQKRGGGWTIKLDHDSPQRVLPRRDFASNGEVSHCEERFWSRSPAIALGMQEDQTGESHQTSREHLPSIDGIDVFQIALISLDTIFLAYFRWPPNLCSPRI